MIAVGIDLGLKNTAMLALRGDRADYRIGTGPEIVQSASIIPVKLAGMARLDHIVANARRFIDRLVYVLGEAPDIIVFEGPGFGSNQAHSLGHVHGVVKLDLWRRRHIVGPIYDLPPSNLKQYATDKGNSEKQVVMKRVLWRWGFDSDDDNLNDAYVCAMVGLSKLTGTGTGVQLKAITKLEDELYAGGPEERRAPSRPVAGRARRRRVA